MIVLSGCVEISRKERLTTGTTGMRAMPKDSYLRPRATGRSYINPPKLGGVWEQDYENRKLKERVEAEGGR